MECIGFQFSTVFFGFQKASMVSFCTKMQIELVEMFKTEQRNSLWMLLNEGLSISRFKEGGGFCKKGGFVGVILLAL